MSFNQLMRRAEELAVPIEVTLELTHRCNFRCVHCSIPDRHVADSLTTERVMLLLDELMGQGTLFLTLTGGELFMRRDWFEVATAARRRGFSLTIFSNVSLVDDAIAEEVRSLHSRVEVSLYSMRDAVFDAIVGSRGALRRTLGGISHLQRRGVELKLKVPMMRDNVHDVAGVAAFADSIGAGLACDPRIVHAKDGGLAPTRLRAAQGELIPFLRGPLSGYDPPVERRPDDDSGGLMCAAGSRTANITAAGDVLACTVLPEAAGNVNDRPFREIWQSSQWFRELRTITRGRLRECSSCSRLSYCRRCHAQALVEDGDILGPSRWSCAHARAVEEAFGHGR